MAIELFGFEIKRKEDENKNITSFVEPTNDDGAVNIAVTGSVSSSFLDLDGAAKSEAELVQRYRTMLQQPEVSQAVDDIVNEAISITDEKKVVDCITDDVDLPDSIKKKIREEFDNVIKLLDFGNTGYDTFQKWYVDGRINYHVMIDESAPRKGIQEIRYIDPRKIRKVREYDKAPAGGDQNKFVVKKIKNEYFIYNERGFNNLNTSHVQQFSGGDIKGLKIAKDSVVNVTSGLLNENGNLVLSYLHKAYKPLNQLRMMEDAVVIYRISRAPERRIFYIDVGNLPKLKAEQHLRDMMVKHKNRLVYDAGTGDIKDDRRHMAMTDDFWLPRREGGRGTEITTLPGGQNLGEIEDILYFQKRLLKALNVPVSRMESEAGFSLGRASEISRDEVKFSKFIARLRSRFAILFDKLLEKQLILKGIVSVEDWPAIQAALRYDFVTDNHFSELKQSEILQNRLQLLRDIDEYRGTYFSKDWVQKQVLYMSEDEVEEIKDQIEQEKAEEPEEEEDLNMDYTPDVPVIPDDGTLTVEVEEDNELKEEDRKLIENFSSMIDQLITEESDNE